MYPARFAYAAPTSLDEAIDLLEKSEGEGKILAGGHSLLPLMKLRLAQPGLLVDLGRIPGLSYICVEDGRLAIGAMTTYREITHSSDVRQHLPVLAEAAGIVGDGQVRARGTLGGSLAHADPAADLTAVVLALGATLRARGPAGEREIGIDDFFVDMLTTALEENELIAEIRIPILPAHTAAAYQKFEQPASHYALTGVCARVTLDEAGTIASARVAITGVGPKPYRPSSVEEALVGKSADEAQLDSAVQSAADGIDVQGDIHANEAYRAHLARVLTRRAVLDAMARVQD